MFLTSLLFIEIQRNGPLRAKALPKKANTNSITRQKLYNGTLREREGKVVRPTYLEEKCPSRNGSVRNIDGKIWSDWHKNRTRWRATGFSKSKHLPGTGPRFLRSHAKGPPTPI